MAHEFSWIELTTEDPGAARSFYAELFGWSFDEMPMDGGGVYAMFQPNAGGPGGGIMAKPCAEVPTAWMPYVSVDDLETAVAKTTELGGKVHMGPTPVKDHGEFAVVADPSGGVLGLWHNIESAG